MQPTQLYRHFGPEGELLYVGVSNDAEFRLTCHTSKWKKQVCRSDVVLYPSREEALQAEEEAIKSELPIYNRAHIPREVRLERQSMTNEQYRKALAKLDLTQGQAAKFLGISIRTSNGYANDRVIPEYIAKLLRLMIRLKLKPEDVT